MEGAVCLSGRRRAESRRHPDGNKKPASVFLRCPARVIASAHPLFTAAGSGFRDYGHSESPFRESVARIRRARELSS